MTQKKLLTSLFDKINPENINDYIKNNGYKAMHSALKMKSTDIINEIIESGLKGRGGAGFPTGLKWKFVNESPGDEKFVICNADEGEPGTFKDRYIMEKNPHLFIEGIIIASFAVGAKKAYIYIRGEYHKSIKIITHAIKQAREKNLLGENILKTNFSLDIEIKKGAGSYLCGEELTLIESLEGKRGHPRIKPPFPAQVGLFNKPTLVNNVETFANIPFIIDKGTVEYRKFGKPNATGTKLFAVSGDVLKPGLIEVELGTKLKDIINFCGGFKNNNKPKACLLGGAAGTFIPYEMFDITMDYDSLASEDLTMGSGAIIVLNESRSIMSTLLSIMEFFQHESCGKCVPCRVGCTKIVEQLSNTIENNKQNDFIKIIEDAEYMKRNSLCPLGQSPILPIKSAFRYFQEELIK